MMYRNQRPVGSRLSAYRSRSLLDLRLYLTQHILMCGLLLGIFGGTVTTCLPSIAGGSRTAPAAHDESAGGSVAKFEGADDSQRQFIRPTGGAKIGTTNGFFKASDLFRAAINESIAPCDDFYEFACGRWIATNNIPDDLTSYGHFSELREKVNMEMRDLFENKTTSSAQSINTLKQIYAGCMDVERLNELRSSVLHAKLVEFGHWPIIHGVRADSNTANSNATINSTVAGFWSPADFDFTRLLIAVSESRDTDTFVDVYIALDQRNVSRRLLHFDQGGLGLGSSARDYYLNASRYSKQLNAYKAYMIEKITLLAADAGLPASRDEISSGVRQILDFEKEFARILVPEDERRNYTKMYNIRRLSQMPTIFGKIDWYAYFRALMPEDMHNYLTEDPEVVVNEPEFFDRLTALIDTADPETVADYVLWRYASAWSFQLDERYDDIQQACAQNRNC